jgi:hypothetical protein
LVLLLGSLLEVALVALFGQWDRFVVPLCPAAGFVAGDEQDAVAPWVEGEQDPYAAWLQLFEVGDRRSVDGVDQRSPEGGPTSARVSMACTTLLWVAGSRQSIQSRTSLTT